METAVERSELINTDEFVCLSISAINYLFIIDYRSKYDLKTALEAKDCMSYPDISETASTARSISSTELSAERLSSTVFTDLESLRSQNTILTLGDSSNELTTAEEANLTEYVYKPVI
uniref:Uncharacterized protein n=1 Tax=Heterorhabditis bacteriophora TaxID=37862 RepID=A0A1I7XHT1_HETBA